ncbi:hypothetical protein [Acetobacterium carbinolicum]|uniref:hypothetical protein n=1 Tax=Acetobacterium carbinolicum TaxID=52690 RepID=UPI0039C95832
MNRRFKIGPIIKASKGYTIMEAIIAIAVCGAALVMILGLYGMAIKTEMVSKAIFSRSVEINSIVDEININLKESSTTSLNDRVNSILMSRYPNYELKNVVPDHQPNLYTLEIAHTSKNSRDRVFYIKVFWRQDETPVI